ncbi:TPR domain protein [Plectosphaerella cucumerina]|uniref:TPR domain protein n=1 Tax=Plectosphaerella cucumerina TaxID=40658 RepID=A0A8K0X933_9PEZI|nr:TPR domain protein [Plectosphaerella cucumerina]
MDSLDDIAIGDMRLEGHHRGTKTVVRVLTYGCRSDVAAVKGIVEDQNGTAIILQLCHQPEEDVVPAKEIMRPGDVFVVKEPFFEANTTGDYTLRVDHLGDLVRLDGDFEDRIPSKWKRAPVTQTSTELRNEGNQAVKGERWAEAHRLYTSAIHVAKSPEEEHLACLNRSLANLRLGYPLNALLDAQRASEISGPSEKGFFRESRALYALGDFDKCLEKLLTIKSSFSDTMSPQINVEIKRTKDRLAEQRTGEYNFQRMYKQAEKTPPVIDCANYSIVEARSSKGRGQGLFTTVPVKAGQLLLCEKALAHTFIDQYTPCNLPYHIAISDDMRGKPTVGGSVRTLSKALQKMHNDPKAKAAIDSLYRGDETWGPFGSEVDGHPVTNSFVTKRVTMLNGFGCSRTSLEDRQKTRKPRDMMRIKFGSEGIWSVASRMNHSCYVNCQRSYIGDMQIVRAARDLPAGAELFIEYRSPRNFETYDEAQKKLQSYGFICACEICTLRKAMSPQAINQLKSTFAELGDMLYGNRPADAYHIPALQRMDMSKAERLLDQMEKLYPHGPVRVELCEPFMMVGSAMLGHHRPADAIRIIAKGLRLIGFEVTATLYPRAEFRIKRWGYVHEEMPLTLMSLYCAYRWLRAKAPCDELRRYARVAYSIHVGEDGTMETECQEFAHP